MYTINDLVAKAVQKDHLQSAKNTRVSRQWQALQKLRTAKKQEKR